MTSHNCKIEVLPGPERRRRWSTSEKLAIIQETYEPLFTWRKLATQGALMVTTAEEDVVPTSESRALQNQVRASAFAR